jgi:autotransporter-associated beta strand protein
VEDLDRHGRGPGRFPRGRRLPAVALYDYARYYAPTVSTAASPFRWIGGSGTAWSGTAGWDATTGRAISGTTANAMLTVAGGTGGSLVYDRSLGTTRYYNVYGSGLVVGGTGADGSMTITGGTFSTLNASAVDVVAGDSGASGLVNVAGGVFVGNIFGTTLAPRAGATARLTITGGTATLSTLTLGGTAATAGSSAVELAGGMLVANGIEAGPAGGTSTVAFNGGTLRSAGTSTTFLEGLSDVRIRGGGATIDTSGGSVTVNQPLLADPASPGGGLTKTGSGTLTLGGTNTYAGGTTIRGGTLAIAADNRLGAAAGDITLNGGGLLTLASFTLQSGRSVNLGPAGGAVENAGTGNLVVAGSVTGSGAALTVRTTSAVNGAAFLDGAVDLGSLVLTGSATGVGLRQSATVASAIGVAPGQTLHLNGLNGSGTATATYRGFDVLLTGGTFRNRYGGNTFTRTLTLAADSTLENRVGNGNSLTLSGGTVALGSSTLTVRSGTSVAEWVAIGARLTGGTGSGLVVAGGGRLSLSGSNPGFDGRVVIEQGELRLESPAAVDAGVAVVFGGTATAKFLTLAAVDVVVGRLDLSGTERIDLGTGSLTVSAGLSPERLVAALVAGRGDGSWRGATGILSSAVASDLAAGRSRAIGWLVSGTGAVTMSYAAPGDTTIDGTVDILDVANVLAGAAFDTGRPASWGQGDFNYDGVVDIIDLADFLGGGLFDAGPYAIGGTPVAGVVAVPEPTIFAVWPLLLALAVSRRRRLRS